MDINVMKRLEVDEDGNATKDTFMISVRDVKDVFKDLKKLLTLVSKILATLPVTAFGTFPPLIFKGNNPQNLLTHISALVFFDINYL
jgi:hypothetical protein